MNQNKNEEKEIKLGRVKKKRVRRGKKEGTSPYVFFSSKPHDRHLDFFEKKMFVFVDWTRGTLLSC